MGLLGALSGLLDENSDKSFEKVIVGAIDKVEGTLNQAVGRAEDGIKKFDQTVKKVDNVGRTVEKAADKMARTSQNL